MADHHNPITVVTTAVAGTSFAIGDYTVIVLAALVGALVSLSSEETATRKEGALFLLKMVGTASVLTGAAAYLLEHVTGFPASKALGPVAWAIAAFGNNWKDVLKAIKDRAVSFITGYKKGDSQ